MKKFFNLVLANICIMVFLSSPFAIAFVGQAFEHSPQCTHKDSSACGTIWRGALEFLMRSTPAMKRSLFMKPEDGCGSLCSTTSAGLPLSILHRTDFPNSSTNPSKPVQPLVQGFYTENRYINNIYNF